ncbi:flagellar protein FlaG [Gracilibacillus ureilyticus]|uniref:Flagellar protein FlaG n=1 Tax=Gracilibacillus ureilyticus TaxID=531814 RepID=A0A1H9S9V7_9BACI|nr:flagellar protein FlaG [Gracilibacillus ureilyticus]SER81385.1 flagellar protein FlaG [Gracilibacillus ureilyticus]
MEIGKMITGSPILQNTDTKEQSISAAVDRSNNHVNESKKPENKNIPEELSKENAKSMVDGLNSFLEPTNTNIRYEYHEKLERYYVTVVNSDTDEVVKEIPPKKLLDVYAGMAELMGFIVDEKI